MKKKKIIISIIAILLIIAVALVIIYSILREDKCYKKICKKCIQKNEFNI